MKNRYTSIPLFLCLFLAIFTSCGKSEKLDENNLSKKIPVLNVGTFHMGETSDSHKTDFDSTDKNNQKDLLCLDSLLAQFKPTIILVEIEPKYQKDLTEDYEAYKNNPKHNTKFSGEVKYVAYEVGRLANTSKIIAIDHQMGYNYLKIDELAHEIEAKTYLKGYKSALETINSIDKLPLIQRFIAMNSTDYYNALINLNADLMLYVNTEDNFEGADVASDFYNRNLRMFANINRIKVTDGDRILILSGATHAAFFEMFMSKSPKYELIPITNYLK